MPDLHPILQAQALSARQWAAIAELHDDALITAGGMFRRLTVPFRQMNANLSDANHGV